MPHARYHQEKSRGSCEIFMKLSRCRVSVVKCREVCGSNDAEGSARVVQKRASWFISRAMCRAKVQLSMSKPPTVLNHRRAGEHHSGCYASPVSIVSP